MSGSQALRPCPKESDISELAKIVGGLAGDMRILTKDVDRMVGVTSETNELIRLQSKQTAEIRAQSQALERAFDRIKALETSTQQVREAQIKANTKAETRIGFGVMLLKYWPAFAAASAAMLAGGAAIKSAVGG
jgi:hypothetical protein